MQAWQLLAAARRVRLGGLGPTRDALAGGYRSAFRGAGIEYEESREYAPGDDVSSIDWKVTARLGRPFVKRYREERARTVMLAVDASRSMTVYADGSSPLQTAALAAVTLAVSAAASRDRVGLVLFSDQVEAFVPPGKGPGQPQAVAAALAGTTIQGGGTDPGPALDLLAATLTHQAVIFVFSDFLLPGAAARLGRLAARHEVTAAFLTTGQGEVLPPHGLLAVADVETGQRALLDCGDPKARARYAAARAQGHAATLAAIRAAGVGVVELATGVPPAPALDAYFRRRARPGRFSRRQGEGARG